MSNKKVQNQEQVVEENEDMYERVMSENEFRIRQYPENVLSSRLRPQRVLRMIQYCFEQELAVVDLDITQCFKTGWLQPGHRMIKAFGYNPAGDRSDEAHKFMELLVFIRESLGEAKGSGGVSKKTRWRDINAKEVLGTFGAKGPRFDLLNWLSDKHGKEFISEGSLETLVKKFMGTKEERQLSPMWLEVAILKPNIDDPKEVHECESKGVEDPQLVIRAGFKQNDMGYFVLMPQLAAFHRTIGGVFTDIEQKSYYPYYPFSKPEQAMLLAGIHLLLKQNPEDWKSINSPEPVTIEKLQILKRDIEGICDERGPQVPGTGDKEQD